jgi:hypothetical protein
MKKSISLFLCLVGFSILQTSIGQGLQVNPPSSTTTKTVAIPHSIYPTSFFFNEPQILSVDLNESGDKFVTLQNSGVSKLITITEIQSSKRSALQYTNIQDVTKAIYLSDNLIALEIQSAQHSFDIIEVTSSKVVGSIPANEYLGSTGSAAFFSNQSGSNASIIKYDFASKKNIPSLSVTGEVFGWYFSKAKGIVAVASHSNMISRVFKIENEKLGAKILEFSSGYYFETKGCDSNGEVLYGITNFQSTTTYPCAISKTGIKPLNSKTGENCTSLFMLKNEIALISNNINAAEYQESKDVTVQKILAFSKQGFKGASIQIIDVAEKNNSILFCVEGEVQKPTYFLWQNNKAVPVSNDKYAAKNLTFISSEVAQIQTGELTPQSGRMYLPTKNDKSSYPLVIYIPENIFLPYTNQFNPTVQHLCQSGYAVFVWNTRYSFRPKIGFSYADLVGSFSEDISLLHASLKKDYAILPGSNFIFGEGLGAYLALNASASNPEVFSGVISNRIEFPGSIGGQDLTAARMFGEDAQSKWASPDLMSLSSSSIYLNYAPAHSNTAIRLSNAAKQNKIKWNERPTATDSKIDSKELEAVTTWMLHLSKIETRIIEDKPKVDVKKK